MTISSKIPAVGKDIAARTYQPQYAPVQAQKTGRQYSARRFDSVTISGEGAPSFEMELRSRISREVRTATASSQISSLRSEIQQGTYHVDVSAIAGKMLLLGGAV